MRGKTHQRLNRVEQQHAIALLDWCVLQRNVWPELDRLIHIPNEGKRSLVAGGILKRMGLRKGCPDYFLPAIRFYDGLWRAGLWIELKAPNKKPTPEQEDWLYWFGRNGYAAVVCHGWIEAKDLLISYLSVESAHLLSGSQWRQ